MSREQVERLAEPWLFADVLLDTRIALEDLKGVPDEAFGAREAG